MSVLLLRASWLICCCIMQSCWQGWAPGGEGGGGGGGGEGGYSVRKLLGVCHGPLKIGPQKIEAKWYFGAKKIEFCEDLYPKDRFCVGGWEKTPQKDRARSCQSEKRGSKPRHICITHHIGSTPPGVGLNLIPEMELQLNFNSNFGIGIEIVGIENGIGVETPGIGIENRNWFLYVRL